MPATPVPTDVVVDALRLACRAPSLHNSQPWRWVVASPRVQLFADPTRLLRGADSSGREALISCGAALHHFRVAMAAGGWATTVERFPDTQNRLHLADIIFAPAGSVSPEETARADAILLRHSERLPLAAPHDWGGLTDPAETVTGTGVVRVDHLLDDDRPTLAEASRLTELLRSGDAIYQRELALTTGDFMSHEGIPRAALVSERQRRQVDVGRTFPADSVPRRHGHLVDDHSAILVLSTVDESHDSVLRCGEVLSAVLLDATTAGMATCTVSHVIELPPGREVVAALLGTGTFPQVLVRVGRPSTLDPPPPATPRRPLDEVVELRRSTA
ncbi:NAD(P)H nitroreductase [Mycolicibacterium duvalii]|uniref:Putative NAD(P)H nitroreductase acg n=1 Tax=Mycolicibacterium duvalii TaxID=39688 RepID=A0A7I7JYG1_9MYCO|nr:NAD(P)H nitroreductase [Mycolicibacterium duvalii]MCV7368697.1 NAD(P)H nitroreductase [Mycolicibacterium duvalii]PEG35634.1 NAD(P)H nitroreductase [Mycolicibacterium duvalii]BBX16930.1 putative NAD(P)H nitroreductase acg [Mycolicibacterium duvalii]